MTAIRSDFRFSVASNALIKAWGAAINTALTGIGLVQTTDTGQINWATTSVTNTGTGAGGIFGYEIYRFNDSLQSLRPIFIKVEYGLNQSSNLTPTIQVYTGGSTNGAGTLTSLVTTVRAGSQDVTSYFQHPYAPNTLAPAPHFFSGDGSSFAMAICGNDTGAPGATASAAVWYWFVERTRNADGTYNSDGWVYGSVLSDRQNAYFFTRHQFHSGLLNNVYGSNFYAPVPFTGNTNSGSLDTNSVFTTYPWLVGMPKPEGNSLTTLCFQNGLNWYQTTQLVVYGATHTYLALPGVVAAMPGSNNENNAANQNWCTLLMRYE